MTGVAAMGPVGEGAGVEGPEDVGAYAQERPRTRKDVDFGYISNVRNMIYTYRPFEIGRQ